MYVCLNGGTTGRGLAFDEFAKLASSAGFPGCDVDLGYAVKHGAGALGDLFGKLNLRFGGWGPGDWRGTPEAAAECNKQIEAAAPLAAKLGIDSCSTWIMPASDLAFADNRRFHVERLKGVATRLAAHGLRLGLEFVAPYHLRVSKPHEFVFTPGAMLEMAAEIGSNVGLLVDCFHLHCAGVPASYVAKMPADKIVLVHINDAPRVAVSDVADFDRLLPGEGAIDQKAFKAALVSAGYQGPVALEVFGRLKDVPNDKAARLAVAACTLAGWIE